MKLTPAQLAEFDEQGYLFLPEVFSLAEMELLTAELPGIFAQDRPEVIREKGSTAPRSAFYVQTWNPAFEVLARHPRLVEPGMQILSSDKLYMHQFKINAKAAFDGAVWQWHQDYATWFNDDDMPTPRAMNIALFLAEANEFNGPLMFIPRSHRRGRLEAGHDVTTTSYPLWTIDNATITRLVEEGGIVAPKGPPGSILLFHGNLVHASGSNLTPGPDGSCTCPSTAATTRSAGSSGRPGSPTATSPPSKCCPTIASSGGAAPVRAPPISASRG